jgi:hypothetical protein
MHGETCKYEGMGYTYWYAGLAALPHIQRCNWIKNNLTGQGCSSTQHMDFLGSRQHS